MDIKIRQVRSVSQRDFDGQADTPMKLEPSESVDVLATQPGNRPTPPKGFKIKVEDQECDGFGTDVINLNMDSKCDEANLGGMNDNEIGLQVMGASSSMRHIAEVRVKHEFGCDFNGNVVKKDSYEFIKTELDEFMEPDEFENNWTVHELEENQCKMISHLHKDDEAFKCRLCDKAFKRQSNWLKHELTHKEKEPSEGQSESRQCVKHSLLKQDRGKNTFKCKRPLKAKSRGRECVRNDFLRQDCRKNPVKGQGPLKGKSMDRICEKLKAGVSKRGKYTLKDTRGDEKEKNKQRGKNGKLFQDKLKDRALVNDRLVKKPIGVKKKSVKCDFCKKLLASSICLQVHLRIHTGEKPYTCTHCDRTFTDCSTLKKHEVIHSDDRPFTCKFCSTGFKRKSHLDCHEKSHTGALERRFMCEHCGKTVRSLAHLEDHLVVHTGDKPFKCETCNRKYGTYSALKRHQRSSHENASQFECRFCKKGFGRRDELTKHERIHTGEKPFKCQYCDASFRVNSSMRKHERVRHASAKQ